jgi:hypothetical protein
MTEHRFSSLEERRRLMRAKITRELAPHPKRTRKALLERLKAHFPVLASTKPPDDELKRLRSKVEELERRKPEPPAPKSGKFARPDAGPALPWAELVSGDDIPGADRTLKILQEVVRFSLALETFLLGLVQSTTSPGDQTSQFRLPRHRETLRMLLNGVADGKVPSLPRVQEYLMELQQWQVACLAAYHQAPRAWFEKLWKRINPAQIESIPRPPGWKLRGEEAEWWEIYRQAVKDIGPDVAHDQILQTASRLAQEEFDKLKKASEES